MNDDELLRRAIALAERSPRPDPNPRVGAVLARDGQIVGEGWHEGAGSPHAEVVALTQAGEKARGATAYVSLEPCAHTGRTGPCSTALVLAGVTRVVYAQSDPNSLAAGGARRLESAGVQVELRASDAAAAFNREWAHSITTGRPFVTWKTASTIDGRSAAADGSSRWITGEEARADVHRLRSSVGAIIAGTGTVLADDPSLTVRTDGILAPRQPLRVVVGTREIPQQARVLDGSAGTVQVPDPHAALANLRSNNIHHALLEGGPTLAAGFLQAGLVDEVVAYVAPALLGAGTASVGYLGITSMAGIRRFELVDVTRFGDDVRLILRPTTTQGAH